MRNSALAPLRAVRRQKYKSREIGQREIEGLLKDLDDIADRLQPHPRSSGWFRRAPAVDKDVPALRTCVSLDVPDALIEHPRQYLDQWKQRIEHDRRMLEGLLAQARAASSQPLACRYGTPRAVPIDGRPAGIRRTRLRDDLVADDALWRGHVQSRIARLFDHLPGELAIDVVRVSETRIPPHTAAATSRSATVSDCDDRSHRSTQVVLGVGAGGHALEARIVFRVAAQSRAAGSRLLAGASNDWAGVQAVFPVLQEALRVRRSPRVNARSLAEFLIRMREPKVDPDPHIIRILCRWSGRLRTIPGDARAAVVRHIVESVAVTDWGYLAGDLVPLIAVLNIDRSQAALLYQAVCARCPRERLTLDDLRFLVRLREVLNFTTPPFGLACAIVRSSIAAMLLKVPGMPEAVRALVGGLTPGTLEPPVVHLLHQFLADVPATRFGDVLGALDPILAAVPGDDDPASLIAAMARRLGTEVPRVTAGAWSLDEKQRRFAELVAAFCKLGHSRARSAFDVARVDPLTVPLPSDAKGPVAYPASYWHLIRNWLSGTVNGAEEWDEYCREVAFWHLQRLARSASPAVDAPDAAACGRWLRKEASSENVYLLLTEDFATSVARSAGAPQKQRRIAYVEALAVLITGEPQHATVRKRPPSGAAGSAGRTWPPIFDAILATAERDLRWPLAEWKEWLTTSVPPFAHRSSDAWRSSWTRYCLIGFLFDSESQEAGWWEELSKIRVPPSDLEVLDGCLADFEASVEPTSVTLDAASRRLHSMAGWLELSGVAISRWFEWSDTAATPGAGGGVVMTAADRFRVQAAALRLTKPTLLATRVGELWVSLAVELSRQHRMPELVRFMELSEEIGVVSSVRNAAVMQQLAQEVALGHARHEVIVHMAAMFAPGEGSGA